MVVVCRFIAHGFSNTFLGLPFDSGDGVSRRLVNGKSESHRPSRWKNEWTTFNTHTHTLTHLFTFFEFNFLTWLISFQFSTFAKCTFRSDRSLCGCPHMDLHARVRMHLPGQNHRVHIMCTLYASKLLYCIFSAKFVVLVLREELWRKWRDHSVSKCTVWYRKRNVSHCTELLAMIIQMPKSLSSHTFNFQPALKMLECTNNFWWCMCSAVWLVEISFIRRHGYFG